MKLVAIVPHHPLSVPGIRAAGTLTIEPGKGGTWTGWSAQLRGPSVFLISPPGWQIGAAPAGDVRRVIEIPRSSCDLVWDFEPGEKVDGTRDWIPAEGKPAKAKG